MDGNGRWAQARGFGRTRGHWEGARRVDEIVTACCNLGIRYLTLYAFSTENWSRPSHEVSMLMHLLVRQLRVMDKKLIRNGVALVAQGSLHRLPRFAQLELKRVMRVTASENPKLHLNLSLSYGGRQEILDAVTALARKVERGEMRSEDITETSIREHLYHPEIPDPDLLIRTGGESRVSNFLLWEIAYSELVFTNVLWPEFTVSQLNDALSIYSKRQRRFGMTSDQIRAMKDGYQPTL